MRVLHPLLMLVTLGSLAAIGNAAPVICENSVTKELAAYRVAPCPSGSVPFRFAGVNIFDVLWNGSEGMPAIPGATFENTLVAMQSYADSGGRVFRFFAGLWGSTEISRMIYWVQNEDAYWAHFDRVMDAIESIGLYVIPSIGYDGWNSCANTIFGTNETLNDVVMNRSSTSNGLAIKYYSQVVTRYHSRKNVLLWELGNELNLLQSIPPPHCGDAYCFNSTYLSAFLDQLVSTIRAVDNTRPISSGLSIARPSAWHQDQNPGGADMWQTDTQAQWIETLTLQQSAVDVWSIHLYPKNDTCWFADAGHCVNGTELIQAVAEGAKAADALLFVGEYGGPNPHFTGPTAEDQAWDQQVLDTQVADAKEGGSFVLSGLWAWGCLYTRDHMDCVWPNSTRPEEAGSAAMAQRLQDANAAMGSL